MIVDLIFLPQEFSYRMNNASAWFIISGIHRPRNADLIATEILLYQLTSRTKKSVSVETEHIGMNCKDSVLWIV